MKLARVSLAAGAAALLGVTAVGAPGAAASDPLPYSVALPMAHFSHLVVDGPHGHVFISGGAGTDGVVATGLDGQDPVTIGGEPGATGLALSDDGATLYAALPDQDAIAAISTADLTESARYFTGLGTHPDSLAVAGGTLWFGYGTAGAGGIGSLDAAGTVALSRDGRNWPGRPTLAGTPTPSGEIAAEVPVEVPSGDSAIFATYQAAGGTLIPQAASSLPVPGLADFAITADGQEVVVAWGPLGNNFGFRVRDLAPAGDHLGEPVSAPAVAVAPDGTLAGCACNGYAFESFPERGSGFYRQYSLGALRLAPRGLAWAPDGSRLYGVGVDADGDTPTLVVGHTPEVAAVSFAGDWTMPLAPGEPLSFDAALNTTLDESWGHQLPGSGQVTRYDGTHPGGVPMSGVTLGPATAGSPYGGFRFTDTAPLTGTLSYRVEYSGGGRYAPADQTLTVPIAKYAPALALSAPASATRGAALTVKGQLSWPHAHVTTGSVHLVKVDAAHPSGATPVTAPVAADGSFSFRDTPQVGGTDTYRVSYDGGTSYLPVSASASVQVSRATPDLSVTTNASSYHYTATATVTAHLGTTYNSRAVTLYAQSAGGSRKVLKTGTVDAHGNLTVSYRAIRNTVFTASFAGDYRYLPRTATRTVSLTPGIRTATQYPLASARIGSTTYQVFYKSELNLGFNVLLTPTPTPVNGCTTVVIEHYYGGAWHHATTSGCVPLYGDGWFGYPHVLSSFVANDRYRIIAHYTPPAKGAQVTAAWSAWTYLTVRP